MGAEPKGEGLIVWMDLEMTGLDPERERIIEIAALITDAELEIVAEGPNLVVHQDDALLAAMDPWNTEHHSASGLVERVRASTVSEAQAEGEVLATPMYDVLIHVCTHAQYTAGQLVGISLRPVRYSFKHVILLLRPSPRDLDFLQGRDVFEAAVAGKARLLVGMRITAHPRAIQIAQTVFNFHGDCGGGASIDDFDGIHAPVENDDRIGNQNIVNVPKTDLQPGSAASAPAAMKSTADSTQTNRATPQPPA